MAHNAKYDREEVLRPVYKKFGMLDSLPNEKRWTCTMMLAGQNEDIAKAGTPKDLDSLLEYFYIDSRDEGAKHDAVVDCQKTAELYMKLKAAPKKKAKELEK